MRVASARRLTRLMRSASAATQRAGCVVVLCAQCVLTACGGGDVGVSPTSTPPTALAPTPTPARAPTPASTQTAAPAPGAAQSIDDGASGDPVGLRVLRGANGDAFAVWRAHDGTRHNLWANRYRAAAAAWSNALSIETSAADIFTFDLTVDPRGNAVVVWNESAPGGTMVMSVRFDSGAGLWSAPQPLSEPRDVTRPRVASDATGAVLAVWGTGAEGRFFDPVSGAWQPLDAIEDSTFGTGDSNSPVPILDGSGNALVVFRNERVGAGILASNYFSRSTGSWGRLPPEVVDIFGAVPGSFVLGFTDSIHLAAAGGGDFLAAWQSLAVFDDAQQSLIRIARFTSRTRTWSTAETVLTASLDDESFRLQRLASDAAGNAQLIWTQRDGTRTALKAMRIDGAVCSAAEVLDRAIGGGAASADLGVDAQGNAIAIWQQFEGGRPDDGSRSNIAINRFDAATGLWSGAAFAETQAGNAISPGASAGGGQMLLGWIQSQGGVNRVKALVQPLAAAEARQ